MKMINKDKTYTLRRWVYDGILEAPVAQTIESQYHWFLRQLPEDPSENLKTLKVKDINITGNRPTYVVRGENVAKWLGEQGIECKVV